MLVNTGSPPVLRSWVILGRPALPRLTVQVLTVRPTRGSIVVVEQSPASEHRKQLVDDVLERTGLDGICLRQLAVCQSDRNKATHQVEAIDVGLAHPSLHLVCDLLWRSDRRCAQSADCDVLADGLLGPLGDLRRRLGPGLDGGSAPVRVISLLIVQ